MRLRVPVKLPTMASLLAITLIASACNFGGSVASTATAPAATNAPAVAATTAATTVVPLPTTPAPVATTAIPAATVAPAATKVAVAATAAIPATTVAPATKAVVVATTAVPATVVPPATKAANSQTAATAAVAQAKTPVPQSPQPTQAVPATAASGAIVAPDKLPSPRVLAWNPNTLTLGWYAASGQPINLTDKLPAKSIAFTCATAGDQTVIYLGGDRAQPLLYPLGGGALTPLGDTSGVTCAVPGRTAFSPDGKHLGLIDYSADTFKANFWAGTLRILNLPDASEAHSVQDVNSFQLYNDGVLFFQIFASTSTANKGQGTGAALRWWDGKSERVIEDPITPSPDCQIVTGRALKVADKVYTLLGEKCKGNSGSSWRIIRTDFAGGNSINLPQASGTSPGAYFGPSNTNDMWLLPDNSSVLIATPNGLAGDIIDLTVVALADGKQTPVIKSVVTDQFPISNAPRFLHSPTGDKLAFVTRDANQSETLYLYDLTTPTAAPIQVVGGNRGDRIPNIAWAPDAQRIYYVTTGDTNAFSYQGINNGDHKLVLRGTFQGLVISPDGTLATLTQQIKASTNDLRSNLVLISIADQNETTLVEGSKGDAALTPLYMR